MPQGDSKIQVDEDLLRTFFTKTVDVASKSAEASTDIAASMRAVEDRVSGMNATLTTLVADVGKLRGEVKRLREEEQEGFMLLLATAMKNPQTLVIILSIIAAAFGVRVSLPQTTSQIVTTEPSTAQEKP